MKDFEIFKNDDNCQIGFSGVVAVYDSEIYVDTRSGVGYDEVIKKLNPLIYKFTKKYYMSKKDLVEDIKQDIVLIILDGIKKFNPEKETKLSTFIEMYVNQKLIKKVRDNNRDFRSATSLNISKYKIICRCGFRDTVSLSPQDIKDYCCSVCGKKIEKIPRRISVGDINASDLSSPLSSDQSSNPPLDMDIFQEKKDDSDICFANDLQNWVSDKDEKLAKIISLYCFNDYSITAASKLVGITSQGGNGKLKDLKKNKKLLEILGR